MRFPYREYLTTFPGSTDFRLIIRPVINIRAASSIAEARWDALVDTGADETLMPMSLAKVLKINLDEQFTSEAAGITGGALQIRYGEVEIQIDTDDETLAWKETVGFVDFASVDDELIVLGHGGFLDYFTATFDGERGELELIPNGLLPSRTA